MEDFDLIVAPVKQVKVKLELVSGEQNLFPALRKYILWSEYSGHTWSSAASKTWQGFGTRDQNSEDFVIVQEMAGDVVSLNLSLDGNSDIRRIISVSLHMDDPAYFESNFAMVWINRLIRVQFGLFDFSVNEYRWFPIGSYLVTQSDYQFNASTSQLTMNLADLMASATEHRGDQIGSEVVIYAGTSMQEALAGTVERFFPFTFSEITDFAGETVPYDLEFDRGIYPYEIAKKIVGLYPGYEHYYDTKGTYTVQTMPTLVDEEPVLTEEQMAQLVIADNGNVVPQDIKNITEVWGKELDADHTAENCSATDDVYSVFISDAFTALTEGMTIAFTPDRDTILGQKIKIQSLSAYPIMVVSGDGDLRSIQPGEMKMDRQYVVKYTNQTFVLQGQSEIHVLCALFTEAPSYEKVTALKSKYGCQDISIYLDRDSRFTIDWIGEKVQVKNGGEYENIYTTELAFERAYYDTWRSARIQNTIELEMLYVPWLDINHKVRYTSLANNETNDYLVQKIQVNVESFTMTVSLSRFYPLYPWVLGTAVWSEYAEQTWGDVSELYWEEITYPVS